MAIDPTLADRVRLILASHDAVSERRMFGGLSFLLFGNFACGVLGDDLIVRLDRHAGTLALQEPHVRPMDFTGRPMAGWVYVAAEATASDDALRQWVDRATTFAGSLPPK